LFVCYLLPFSFLHNKGISDKNTHRKVKGMTKKAQIKKIQFIEEKKNQLNKPLEQYQLTPSLSENIRIIQNLFADNDTLIVRQFENYIDPSLKFCIIYNDGVVSSEQINENILAPLMVIKIHSSENILEEISRRVIQIGDIKNSDSVKEIVESIAFGDTVLFSEGSNRVLILSTKSFVTRSISEPEGEKNLSGPREGFNESLMTNLSLIRRRLRTNELKIKTLSIGRLSATKVAVCYIGSIVNHDLLNNLMQRLNQIDIDAVLDSNYLTELIRGHRYSIFRTIGYTERPDAVIGKILEGRIAIFVEGSPTVLTLPYLFIENFQSSEDYYLSFYYTSFARILRILAFILTVIIPGLYISVVAFNQEIIPTPLLINVAMDRRSVPLPASIEAYIMLVVFDLLRETGIRMPSNIGQALSIVGALVIGQAAVDAKLVASPMIIVVALIGITGLLVPKLNAPIIYIRFFLLTLASLLGFFGLFIGISVILIHILSLRSFGVSQIDQSMTFKYQDAKDIFIRAPWWSMITRPKHMTPNKVRQIVGENGNENKS